MEKQLEFHLIPEFHVIQSSVSQNTRVSRKTSLGSWLAVVGSWIVFCVRRKKSSGQLFPDLEKLWFRGLHVTVGWSDDMSRRSHLRSLWSVAHSRVLGITRGNPRHSLLECAHCWVVAKAHTSCDEQRTTEPCRLALLTHPLMLRTRILVSFPGFKG